jgi:hypothetical protein
MKAFILIIGAVLVVAPLEATDRCAVLTPQVRNQLISYVKTKYHLEVIFSIAVEETGVQAGCYRELRFHSVTPTRPFEASFVVSPDLKYLAPTIWTPRRRRPRNGINNLKRL